MEHEKEIWIDLPGYVGIYSVSTEGRLRSEARLVGEGGPNPHMRKQQIRKCSPSTTPYISVQLRKNGVPEFTYLHRLILTAFVGPCPESFDGCHNDGNSFNNRPSNLRWDSRANNHADKRLHGTDTIGEHHPMAKLDDAKVLHLRMRRSEGATFAVLAAEFNISVMTAYRAATRKSWSHI